MLKDDNDKISLGIESIINQIHKKMPFTKIYVESIYPVNNSLDNSMVKNRDNNRILELNGMIMSLCKKFNFTKYVNIYDSLVKNAKLLFYANSFYNCRICWMSISYEYFFR